MLLTIGRKEKLSVSKGSEIEVSSNELDNGTGNVWYRAILEENIGKSKRKKLSVRHLKPLVKENYLPPLIETTFHRLIRPFPPRDPFPEVDFEEGDVIDAALKGGWWSGSVVKVLGNRRFLVYLRSEPDVVEVERKDLRPHLVWKDDEWFRCEKEELIESDFSAGKSVEVRTEVEGKGDVWTPAIAIKEDEEDETLLVKHKYKCLGGEEDDECAKISVAYSDVRPPQPFVDVGAYKLMCNVEALIESGWCPGLLSKVLYGKRYTVRLWRSNESKEFNHSQLRPPMEWKDGVWLTEEGKVLDSEESPDAAEETHVPTRIRVTVRTTVRDIRASGTEKKSRATRSSSSAMQNPPPALSNGGDVAEGSNVPVSENEPPVCETAVVQLSGEVGSQMVDAVMDGSTRVTSPPEIAATKELRSSVVLGVTATPMTKAAAKTQGKTAPRKKLQTMKNQKGTANDPVGEKAPEETRTRESAHKRKRAQPRKFISAEPKKKTAVAGNGSKTTTTEPDDDRTLASWIHNGNSSSGQPVSQTPDPMLTSVVEKHVNVVNTPAAKESAIVLPFAKKSPLWKVIESMEVFKAVPQRPHFSSLLEVGEESREGDAIGAMVMFTGLLEKVNSLQVDDPISLINRYRECLPKLEKHGFDVTAPRSRIDKLLSIKERQTLALEELKVAEREITEKDNKRRKCEEDFKDITRKILELQRQGALLKEEKVTVDKEITRMQYRAAVLDEKVQNVEQEFRATVTAPW